MKTILILSISLLCAISLWSQPNYRHNIVSLGVGPSFTGSGDDIGTGMFNENLFSLGDRVSLNSRLFFYMFNNVKSYSYYNVPDDYSQQTGLSLDLGLNVSPFKMGKRYAYLMAGGCARYYANSKASADLQYTPTQIIENERNVAITYRSYSYEKGVTPGYYFGIGFTENISTHITYGLKCNFQFYRGGDVLWLMGINIGYDFH